MSTNSSLKWLGFLIIASVMALSCGPEESDSHSKNVNHPAEGEIIFTEIMYDPTAVDDNYGEWVELLNLTDKGLNLKGCIFSDNNHDSKIEDSLSIESNGYLIFGIDRSTAHPSIVEPDWTWGTFNLDNKEDAVILVCGDTIIDQVVYLEDDMSYEPVKGASLSLCPGFEDAEQNDDLANWHFSTTEMSDGDKGTPQEPNDPCQ